MNSSAPKTGGKQVLASASWSRVDLVKSLLCEVSERAILRGG